MGMVKTRMPKIVKTEGVCGGSARIEGTRIRVIDVVERYNVGEQAEEIAEAFHVKVSEVFAALAYYYQNTQEIRQEIREDRKFIESLRQELAGK